MSMTYGQQDGYEELTGRRAMGVHQGSTHHAEGLKMTRSPEERLRQFSLASRHRYLVLLLRVLLPVLGLAIGSLYVLGPMFTSNIELDVGDIKAKIGSVEVSRNSLKMVNPSMQGFDQKQGAYLVEADQATQDITSPHVIHLETIRAKVDHPDRKVSNLTANKGVFDSRKETLTLNGDIKARMSGDLTMRMSTAFIDMKSKTIESDEPVTAEMINGTVTSDSMYADTNQRMLLFKGRVRVKIKSLRKRKPASEVGPATGASGTMTPDVPGNGDLR